MRALFAVMAVSCARDWCGPGTVERDRTCVVASALSCGPGTIATNGRCVALEVPIPCGPGTVVADGVCVPEGPGADCGPGTVVRGEQCVVLNEQWVNLPFPDGFSAWVLQGNHGFFSHNGSSRFAVDFSVGEGTEIVAARAGRVVDLRKDSNSGCGDASCADQANYVVIDHGDATFGQYWHLEQDGALVEVGQLVGRGESVGLSGNTGWSTGPHLHFSIRDALNQSLPLRFDELLDEPTEGLVFPGRAFVSENVAEAPPEALDWSTCPTNLFAFVGATLDEGMPCSRLVSGETVTFSGQTLLERSRAGIALYGANGEWVYQCEPPVSQTFSYDVRITAAYGTFTWFAAYAAGDACGPVQGWASSTPLVIHAE